MKAGLLTCLALAGLMATGLTTAVLARSTKLPTEPIGGKPPAGTSASFKDFETFKDQVLYQRAFEAVLWSGRWSTNWALGVAHLQ